MQFIRLSIDKWDLPDHTINLPMEENHVDLGIAAEDGPAISPSSMLSRVTDICTLFIIALRRCPSSGGEEADTVASVRKIGSSSLQLLPNELRSLTGRDDRHDLGPLRPLRL